MEKAGRFLRRNATESGIENLFWVEMPEALLDETQCRHGDCQPFFFSVELGAGWIKAELYLRSLRSLRCTCSGYCDRSQGRYISDYMEEMVSEAGIRT